MEMVDVYENEKVQIVDNHNGARFETYVIPGPRGSGVICLNGAAARLVQPGDKIIIISYGMMTSEEARNYKPLIAILDENNRVVQTTKEELHSTIL